MLGLVLTALLLAAPQEDSITVTVPQPATALPRLEPLLSIAGTIAPRLAPNRIKTKTASLGLDPFAATPAQWRTAGLNPKDDAIIVVTRRASRVRLGIRDSAALQSHLKAQPKLQVRETLGLGFVSGRPGRPNLLGVEVNKHIWLASHRVVMPVAKKDRAGYVKREIAALAQGVRTWRKPVVERLRKSDAPNRDADAQVRGSGPSPVSSYSGSIWVEPGRFVGSARVRFDDIATLIAQAWVPKRAPRRLLNAKDPVVELVTEAHPTAISELIPYLPNETARLLSGGLHAIMTDQGTLLLALRLRSGVSEKRLTPVTDKLDAQPGLLWALRKSPPRLLIWFPGKDGAAVEAATRAPVKGQASAPASVQIVPGRLLSALKYRDRQATGPRLGLARRTLLRMTLGRVLREIKKVTLQVRKARAGFDIYSEASR